jgi:hypothetical protein
LNPIKVELELQKVKTGPDIFVDTGTEQTEDPVVSSKVGDVSDDSALDLFGHLEGPWPEVLRDFRDDFLDHREQY